MTTQTNTITGRYYLGNVMETASGFKLNEDHSFEFFYSYGALDRSGSGTWIKEAEKIIFNSIEPKREEFALLNSTIVDDNSLTIQVVDANPSLRSNVYAKINGVVEGSSDKNGNIIFAKQQVEKIVLTLGFCPEKEYVFENKHLQHNHFKFRLERSIMEVFFNELVFNLTEEGFEGQHPLLEEGNYQFKKR